MLIDVIILIMLHASIASGCEKRAYFFSLYLVGKIVKLGSWSKFTNWISTSRSICSVSWKKFTYWFPIVGYLLS